MTLAVKQLLFGRPTIALVLTVLSANPIAVARADYVYRYDFANGPGPWKTWMVLEPKPRVFRIRAPGTPDRNHLDGIGPIWLLAHVHSTAISLRPIDLRDAEISIRWRGSEEPGFKIVWWLAAELPKAATDPDMPWQATNWALTDSAISPREEWTMATVRMTDELSRWTAGGTNIFNHGDWGRRYKNFPLNDVLPSFFGTIHLVILGSNSDVEPSGTFEIDEITIRIKAADIYPPADASSALQDTNAYEFRAESTFWRSLKWNLLGFLVDRGWRSDRMLYRYAMDSGIVSNRKKAELLWYAHHYAPARVALAELYYYGSGVERDKARALSLLQSASGVEPQADYLLGLSYSYGLVSITDQALAAHYLRLAAERGHVHAMQTLGRRLMNSDPAEAYFWLRIATLRMSTRVHGHVLDVVHLDLNRVRAKLSTDVASDVERKSTAWQPRNDGR